MKTALIYLGILTLLGITTAAQGQVADGTEVTTEITKDFTMTESITCTSENADVNQISIRREHSDSLHIELRNANGKLVGNTSDGKECSGVEIDMSYGGYVFDADTDDDCGHLGGSSYGILIAQSDFEGFLNSTGHIFTATEFNYNFGTPTDKDAIKFQCTASY